MNINENELREVIQKLLMERFQSVASRDKYRGATDFIGKIRAWARGQTYDKKTGVVYSDPAAFDVREVYREILESKITNVVAPASIMLMPVYARESDASTPATGTLRRS